MSVLINFKICDNDKACSGMSICPNGVFSWNNEKQTLVIDNSKCICCGLCEKACMVSAIKVAHSDEEYLTLKKEIEEDVRNINDLLVDRYGAKPISPAYLSNSNEILEKIESSRSMIVELYNEDSIMCLLKSIPIKDLLDEFDLNSRYRKVDVSEDSFLVKKYNISTLPALLFFSNHTFVGKFEGYVDDENEKQLLEAIKKIK